jgi:hypothetical protein
MSGRAAKLELQLGTGGLSAALSGRLTLNATRKVRFIFFPVITGELVSAFTLFKWENTDTEKIIIAVTFVFHVM